MVLRPALPMRWSCAVHFPPKLDGILFAPTRRPRYSWVHVPASNTDRDAHAGDSPRGVGCGDALRGEQAVKHEKTRHCSFTGNVSGVCPAVGSPATSPDSTSITRGKQ